MSAPNGDADAHPFLLRPHRTFLAFTVPVLFSIVAEPITALVDLAFVAKLGAAPVTGMGAAGTFLSSVIWVFGFLQVGTQTEVARASGRGEYDAIPRTIGVAVGLAAGIGAAMVGACWFAADAIATLMKATGDVRSHTVDYLAYRLVGAPAVLISLAAFGAMRGRLDMRTPLVVAVLVNAINIALDPVLIFGWGPIAPGGVAGAALASSIAQWIGAACCVGLLMRSPGITLGFDRAIAARFAVVGRDMMIRTACLTGFLLLLTREATRIGAQAGAAHHAIRQVWMLTALLLDAIAMTSQSLVGYFVGSDRLAAARRVANVGLTWSLVTGFALTAGMLVGEGIVATHLVPPEAIAAFAPAWRISAWCQPLNAITFVTDGIHWGTSDYRYLRNVMLAATVVGGATLWSVDFGGMTIVRATAVLWWITAAWVTVRAAGGAIRVWPGVGRAPLGR